MLLNPARWPLKYKFLSIGLLLLLIPLSAVYLLQLVERSLVDNLKDKLKLSAQFQSLQLEKNSHWFAINDQDISNAIAKELYVFPLADEPRLDGFFEEWELLEKFRLKLKTLDAPFDPDEMRLLLATFNQQLYLSLTLVDKNIIYPDIADKYAAELVRIRYSDLNGNQQRLFISARAPGKIAVKRETPQGLKIDWRFAASWVETDLGINLELRFPSKLKPSRLQVNYYDVDIPNQARHHKVIATSLLEMSPLVWPSNQLTKFANQLQLIPGQRVWFLDDQGRVMARKGNLQPPPPAAGNFVLRWLLSLQTENKSDKRALSLRLGSSVVNKALAGNSAVLVERPQQGDYAVALAASPVMHGDKVIGAVLIEENIARVQLLQQQTLTQLLSSIGSIIFLVVLIAAWYVSRLVKRVERLKNQVSLLVDEQGRMQFATEVLQREKTQTDKQSAEPGDELDELEKAFFQMGYKLYDYHDYLEKLASRLSHELRTPIAIVRSSLDNLGLSHDDENSKKIIKRAIKGTERLGEIISRMRQASSVKQAMQTADFKTLDLGVFLSQLVEGFNQSFSQFEFSYSGPAQAIEKSISPELFAELMDKLLSNGMDFCATGKPIEVSLKSTKGKTILTVSNSGPLIENKNRRKIFQSLISIRPQTDSGSSNLGLGLYVVKLISDFHGAKIWADNKLDKSGVVFNLEWKV